MSHLPQSDPRWIYATLSPSGEPTVTLYASEAEADQELTDKAYDDDIDPATDFEAWLAAEGGMTAGESAAAYLARNERAHYYGSPFDVEDFTSGPFRRAILDALLADMEV